MSETDIEYAIGKAFMAPWANSDENVFTALQEVAVALKYLGNGDAGTPMGGLEALGLCIKEAGEQIAGAISELAQAIEQHA